MKNEKKDKICIVDFEESNKKRGWVVATVEYDDFFEFLNHSETAKEMSNDRYMFFPNEQKCKEFCRNYHKIAKKYEEEQKRKATKH